jgi:hypothetical protein
MKKKKDKEKPKFNFEKISKDLSEVEHKQHIDQLEPSLTKVYLDNAESKDKKTGVITYKTKFSKKEAEKLSDEIYDAMVYHSHRRVFSMNDETFKKLQNFKDKNGNPYTDMVGRHHYKISRKDWKREIADDEENIVTIKGLEKILEKPLKHHASLLTTGILEKEGLTDPQHMNAVKGAIDKIVDKYKLSKKKFNTKKIHDPGELINLYVALSNQHYSDE